MIKYGVNEQKMLKDIYPEVDILMQNCSVTSVYDSVLRHAFLNEIESQAVSNFREIYQKVFIDATLYRDTEEFEKLCGCGFEFEEIRKEFYKKYSRDFEEVAGEYQDGIPTLFFWNEGSGEISGQLIDGKLKTWVM